MNVINISVKDLKPYERNPRRNDEAVKGVAKSIEQFGFKVPIVVDKDNVIVCGHTRWKAAKKLKMAEVPCIIADDLTEDQIRAFRLADNKVSEKAEWDEDLLQLELDGLLEEFNMDEFGFYDEIASDDAENGDDAGGEPSLNDKFIVPPFSVLDARQGYWRERKRKWKALGIESEKGRDDGLVFSKLGDKWKSAASLNKHTTSIFDPVLCEIAYKWFCTDGGSILDCFAGGSVRGIVAHKLGYHYYGNDLRREQIDANIENARAVFGEESDLPVWTCGDSVYIKDLMPDIGYDMLFTCPPYADLEVYSDDPRDISNMDYSEFVTSYRTILQNSCSMLKDDRFAVVVIGDVRDKDGFYRDLIAVTKNAFYDAGFWLYNELILVDVIGSAALRASRTFGSYRKVVKTHQNVLVFYKGDVKKIKENYRAIQVESLEELVGADFADDAEL